MQNNNLIVLEGGFNEEHEISLSTGEEVKRSLLNLKIKFDSILVSPKNFEKKISKYNSNVIFFNALHGTFGEDGEIQKILEKFSYKYTHSNSKSSLIGFNKDLTFKSIKDTSILVPEYNIINYTDISERKLFNFFVDFGPFVIKPLASGSSFGVKIFKNRKSIEFFLNNLKNNINLYKNHKKLIVQKYIKGRELTVAVLENNLKSKPIEVTEIISKSDFFDYQSKYTKGFSKHILPAKIPKNIYEDCKSYAKLVHDKIKCRGVSRSDFIYDNKKIYFLEINTQPGLTKISLVPEQLKYQNYSFDNLVNNLINCVL